MNEHTFIIRIWIESREIEGAEPAYRGMIKHGPSGETRYLEDIDKIQSVIALYLDDMGDRLGKMGQIRNWLKQQTEHLFSQATGTQNSSRKIR